MSNGESDARCGCIHLGWRPLDFEHQGQIELLLAVEAELRGTADKARLAMMLDQLIEFTNIHFMSEQVLMRTGLSGLRAHEAEHDHLMDQMRDFQKRTESGERPLRRRPFRPARPGHPPYPLQGRPLRRVPRRQHLARMFAEH